jgi:hypothetical protein
MREQVRAFTARQEETEEKRARIAHRGYARTHASIA